MNLKIIDCTIRDGGLLNNWNFSDKFVKASYYAAERSGVDYFEIGYKNDLSKEGLGPYGYCVNSHIQSLFQHKTNIKLLCMIDAGKYTGYEICEQGDPGNPFSGIRVAAYPHEAQRAIDLIEQLHKKGYEVFLQLMASSEWLDEHYEIINKWPNKKILSAVYFADSFGSFIPSDIAQYVNKLKSLGFKNIGFHPHNSLQMAFANTLEAINLGATFVDATIFGMGRGSGNLPVEIILSYLMKKGETEYNVVPYLDVIEKHYLDFTKEYSWGYSLKSLFGGIKNIHPYYIAELFKSGLYTTAEIWNLLDNVKESCPISFDKEKLSSTLNSRFYVPTASQAREVVANVEKQIQILPASDAFELKDLKVAKRHLNKKFVIIANGPTITKYRDQIESYVKKSEAITMGCNFLNGLFVPDYHLFVSKRKFSKYASSINQESRLIVPSFFGHNLVSDIFERECDRIEVVATDDIKSRPIEGIRQQFPTLNVAVVAIITAVQMGANEIEVVGMDGYENENSKEMVYFYDDDELRDDKITSSVRYDNLVVNLKRVAEYLSEQGVVFSIITPTSHKEYYRNVLSK